MNIACIKVSSAMKKDVVSVKPGTSPKEVVGIMIKKRIFIVIVKKESLVIVTKTDLVKGVYDCWVDVLEICTKTL